MNKPTIKTPSDLKFAVEQSGNESHFFTRKTMSFFGDTMRNYGVRLVTITVGYDAEGKYAPEGVVVMAYELYRKHPVKNGLKNSAYFDAETFKRVRPIK